MQLLALPNARLAELMQEVRRSAEPAYRGTLGVISLFFRQWRVRFHTRPLALRARMSVSVFTGVPWASVWRCSSSTAVEGFSLAQCSRRSTADSSSLRGAPLRGLSLRPSIPSLTQCCQVVRTVSMCRFCSLATSRLSRGWLSSSKVLARSRARQSGDFLTTCSSANRSSSLSRVSSRLPIRFPHPHDAAPAALDRIRTDGGPKQGRGSENFSGLT